jgi:hypothetical protein
MTRIIHFTLAVLFVATMAAAQSADMLTGRVLDASGAAVADATVRLLVSGNAAAETQTDAEGRFALTLTGAGMRELVVTAPGFAPSSTAVPAESRSLDVTLQPAPFFEAVNVTSSRTDVARVDPTATVTVISSNELLSSGPATIDDALKAIPGFTLFRRTSSRNSNPTSQGVALRGIGGTSPSGRWCSRTGCRSTTHLAAGCSGTRCRRRRSIALKSIAEAAATCTARMRSAASFNC